MELHWHHYPSDGTTIRCSKLVNYMLYKGGTLIVSPETLFRGILWFRSRLRRRRRRSPFVSALYLENRCTNHSQISHTSLVTYKLVTYRFWEFLKQKNENNLAVILNVLWGSYIRSQGARGIHMRCRWQRPISSYISYHLIFTNTFRDVKKERAGVMVSMPACTTSRHTIGKGTRHAGESLT